jgi:hypothetical protein
LQHYWTGDDDPATRQAQIEDWIEDLGDFPVAVVTVACRDWRHGYERTRRPLPGDIRALCIKAQRAELERKQLTDANAHRDEILKDWQRPEYDGDRRSAEQRRNDAIERQEARYRRAAEWRRDNPNWQWRDPKRELITPADLGVTVTEHVEVTEHET